VQDANRRWEIAMSKKFRAALAGVGTAVLMATGSTAGTASAAPTGTAEGWDDCAPGHFCLWDETGFGGEKIVDWSPRSYHTIYQFPGSAWNRANSVRNNSRFDVYLHNQINASGPFAKCIHAKSGHGDLSLLGWDSAARSATTSHCPHTPVPPV
jgi:microcompartment protein CcmK/EutM